MKKTFSLFAFAALAMGPIVHPPIADAAPSKLVCSTPNVADAGYSFVLAPDSQTANLSEETFMGPRNLADLQCEFLMVTMNMSGPKNYLLCKNVEKNIAVRVFSDRSLPRQSTIFAHVTSGQGNAEQVVEFGNLNCKNI